MGVPVRASATGSPPVPPGTAGPARCVVCAEAVHARFCEACGHDQRRAAPARVVWSLVATADRAWYDAVCARRGRDIASVAFPPYCPPRRFELTGPQMTIGRRSRSRGVEPEIDLSGPPLDPGVSSRHAVLAPRPGGWKLVDVGSTNGTVVGQGVDPIVPHVPVVLADRDRIKIGAWTVLTVTVEGEPR